MSCRLIVRARSGGICERCGHRRAESQHHRRKPGRISVPSNVVDVCGSGTTGCHGEIEANPDAARVDGWWVDAHQDPREVPIKLYVWPSWRVLLDDEGMVTPVHEDESGLRV